MKPKAKVATKADLKKFEKKDKREDKRMIDKAMKKKKDKY